MNELNFKFAKETDTDEILHFIHEIAKYEKMDDEVHATVENLKERIFKKHIADVFFICLDDKKIGFALYFYNFSTFVGKAGIHIEDVYIYPEYRGKGYGKKAFLKIINLAHDKGFERIEWTCLKWNEPSINFYKSLGAITMDEWHTFRLTKEKIEYLCK